MLIAGICAIHNCILVSKACAEAINACSNYHPQCQQPELSLILF
jgi:hypothetical protein